MDSRLRIYGRRLAGLVWMVALAVGLPVGAAHAADVVADDASPLVWAYMEAAAGTPLDDILANRTRTGFNPQLENGVHVLLRPGRSVWIRLRVEPSGTEPRSWVWLDRQAIDLMRLHSADRPNEVLAETGPASTEVRSHGRWPDSFELPLPVTSETATWYIELQGQGHLSLAPRLLTDEQRARRSRTSSFLYDVLYGGFLVIAGLAYYRHRQPGGRALWITVAALSCLFAALVSNYHLALTLGGVASSGYAGFPVALWILACTPLLWATEQFAGIDHNMPVLATGFNRFGFLFLILGLVALTLPPTFLDRLQWGGLFCLFAVALVCVFSLLFDPRQWRWATILVWLALLPALGMMVLWQVQLPPGGRLARRGFEYVLLIQLGLYLSLPWIRQAYVERARQRRTVVPEDSAKKKIERARELMLSSLQTGLDMASGGDLEWIAYRRLLGGLQPVFPQQASAVAAMNYHNEDLLLVEPKEAESRFQTLLAQRSALLKSLSRAKGPQQISIDFDGPEGPMTTVRLAIIPLPIDKPGWGVLLIERAEGTVYSDEELEMAAEFAALATTAGDEADRMIKARLSNEIDPESGVYRRDMIDQILTRLQEAAFRQGTKLSVLHVGIDKPEGIPAEQLPSIVRALADLIREEVDYGETVGRLSADQLMVLTPGRAIGVARELAERICAETAKQQLGGSLTVSIGVSQMMAGEQSAQFMRVRAMNALSKARLYGGNQVQAIASTHS